MKTRQQNLNAFTKKVLQFLPKERVIDDYLKRVAYGTDASCYQLIPKLVLVLSDIDELIELVQTAKYYSVAVTFRAAGTSLSGQALSDSVLILLSDNWSHIEILEEGKSISLGANVIGADANSSLESYSRKIGPDPASINTAKIGGIVANNASGMCCGTALNSYNTLKSVQLVLADGTFLDTSDTNSLNRFKMSHAVLLGKLLELRKSILNNKLLKEKIRHKYRIKNTTGYGLNALLDFDDPVEILAHLMVGSEGTLGFISSVCLHTVPDYSYKSAALLLFGSIVEAARAVTVLKDYQVRAVELLDKQCLQSVETFLPEAYRACLTQEFPQLTALLIDVRAENETKLEQHIKSIPVSFDGLLAPVRFTSTQEKYQSLWHLRKSILPIVGANRKTGTTIIIEDVAFPIANLADGLRDLQVLFSRYKYDDAVVFGHALEGNLHIVFTQGFQRASDTENYNSLMKDIASLVCDKYGGSLKAEHGTGRNIAPFVKQEWGDAAYDVMLSIKEIFDPGNILNPDVILSDKPDLHLQNLKSLPETDPLIDSCIECGFCEPACPSKSLTLSPRQRISVRRQLHRLASNFTAKNKKLYKKLNKDYQYNGVDTCAACGLCSISCPVDINTGDLTRALRKNNNKRFLWLATLIANNMNIVIYSARIVLGIANTIGGWVGAERLYKLSLGLHKASYKLIPIWLKSLHKPKQQKEVLGLLNLPAEKHQENGSLFVYFSACPNRLIPASKHQESISSLVQRLAKRAGLELVIDQSSANYCCGMPFASKGFDELAKQTGVKAIQNLLSSYPNMDVKIVTDASPCSSTLKRYSDSSVEVLDVVDFAHDYLLPHLALKPLNEEVMLHVTCSTQTSGGVNKIVNLANACSTHVIRPKSVSCCGFAGDKGFNVPELNASALSQLKTEIPATCKQGYSNSKTCELGLSHHSGIPYDHIIYLMERACRD